MSSSLGANDIPLSGPSHHIAIWFPGGSSTRFYQPCQLEQRDSRRRNSSIVDPTNVLRIGNERLKYWHANRDHINLGTRLAMSADSPTAPLDPWLQMEVAILRKEPDHKEAFHPEQGLTAEEVVQAYTMGAAYQIGAEERIGSLEVGKRADLVILNQDIFEVKPEEIHKTKARSVRKLDYKRTT